MAEDRTPTAGPGRAAVPETGAPPASPPGYELLGEVGRGGMGVVYRARDARLNREVALKLLREDFPAGSAACDRFLAEAQITGQLQHPGVPAVHELGALPDGRPFLAMKLVRGRTLRDLLNERPGPAEGRGRFVAAFEQVCQAVGYAHAHRVIHRDLKPGNVMVGAFGEVQVMDWGLAKVLPAEGAPEPTEGEWAVAETLAAVTAIGTPLTADSATRTGAVMGTPAYMAPEQAGGEVRKLDARSDVFGLGAILCQVLTGRPPYQGKDAHEVRLRAVRGELADALARLDGCGAEPELVALCKRCLAFRQEDRPADGEAVAEEVARIRQAAEERARRAELERVRVEGEQATAAARSAERRKRRRLVIGTAAVLALAAVGGLSAVLAVQRRANADLAAKNAELADEQAKVQARFELAVKAIETFHTGVGEDALLKNPEFKELRTKLLKEAARFYAEMEKLLAGQTDAKSRKALAAAYFQLGELTDKIGSSQEALAAHRKALGLRRELAAEPGADVETRLDVARSLGAAGTLLYYTGDPAGALRACEELREIATALEAGPATDAVRAAVAKSYNAIGYLLRQTGRPAEALQAFQKALAIYQKLGDDNPAVAKYQSDLALCHYYIGLLQLKWMGKAEGALTAFHRGLAIQQKLADANPAVTEFQYTLAIIHDGVGWSLLNMGKPVEGAEAERKAADIMQKLVDDNPAVTVRQAWLANIQINIGRALDRQKRSVEAFTALEKGLSTFQRLAKVDPDHAFLRRTLGEAHAFRGGARARAGQPAQAAADLRRALELWAALPGLDMEIQVERARALALLAGLGRDANSGVTKGEARTFADQSVAALAEAVQGGWGLPSELKEPDFDPLRGRADFRKLVAEVEARSGPQTTPQS